MYSKHSQMLLSDVKWSESDAAQSEHRWDPQIPAIFEKLRHSDEYVHRYHHHHDDHHQLDSDHCATSRPASNLERIPTTYLWSLGEKTAGNEGNKREEWYDMIWYDSGIDFTKLYAVLAVFGSITLSYTGFNLWSDLVEARWVDWNRHRHFARLCGFEFSIRDVREARASVSRSLPTPKEQGFIKLVIFCWFRFK